MQKFYPASLLRQTVIGLASGALALTLAYGNLAMADSVTLTPVHIAADQFPTLKTKNYNSNFALEGAAGNAMIRSRYGTDTGSDGQKVFVYGYQVDLKSTYVVGGTPGVSAVTLDLPQVPELTGASKLPDKAKLYVIDEADGSDAGVPLQSVEQQGSKLIFTFAAPVRAGKVPNTGDHSVWFGFVTTMRAKHGPVTLTRTSQAAPPPANPSLAAGAKPVQTVPSSGPAAATTAQADNQSAAATPTGDPGIDVFLPLPDAATTDQAPAGKVPAVPPTPAPPAN